MTSEEAGRGSARSRTPSLRLGEALASFTPDALASAIVHKAKLCLLDYFSCALASHGLPWCEQALAVVGAADASDFRSSRSGTIVGDARRAPTQDAAFANAVLGHALVRDDMHIGSVSHLGVVVLPAVLALAEREHVSGRDALAAIACGYEAGGKIGRAILDVDVARRFRPTGITGPVAAAAAAAKLLGLDARKASAAISIAANTVAGYNEWAATGGSEMFFHVGFAARNGLTAASLAAAGAYASPTALDGEAGLLAAFGKRSGAASLALFDGDAELSAVFFKPVPACNFAQTPALAAQRIAREQRLEPDAIDRILVRVTHAAAAYPGCDAPGPFEHVLQAKMSIHYNVAVGLVAGDFDERRYRPAEQPAIDRIARAVRLETDPALTAAYPSAQGAEVVVTMRDGTVHAKRLADVAAAGNDDVMRRFDEASERRLGAARARALRDAVMRLETLPDAAELAKLAALPA